MTLMLEGNSDNRDALIEQLRADRARLENELAATRAEVARAQRQAAIALSNLRKALSPVYTALQQVFGEIEAVGYAEAPESSSKSSAALESWKRRMPGRPAEFIDLLLVHGSMSVKQVMAAAHCGKDAVYQAMSKLGQAGVVVNNGGRYSLKES